MAAILSQPQFVKRNGYDVTTLLGQLRSKAVVPCVKFYSDDFIATWIRAEWNFYRIWITLERSFVKFAQVTIVGANTLSFFTLVKSVQFIPGLDTHRQNSTSTHEWVVEL